MFSSKKQKHLSQMVCGVYLVLLAWLILFKFQTDIMALSQPRSVNLIPFLGWDRANERVHLTEMIYNILVFVPFGVYVNIFFGERPFWQKLLSALGVSLFFEIIQFVFAIGASDMTDLINNTLGGVLGLLLFRLLGKWLGRKAVSLVNGIGIAVEGIFLILFVLLTVANP